MKNLIFAALLLASFSANSATILLYGSSHNDEMLHGNAVSGHYDETSYMKSGGFYYPDYYPQNGAFNGSVGNSFNFVSEKDGFAALKKISSGSPAIQNFSAGVYIEGVYNVIDDYLIIPIIAGQIYVVGAAGEVVNLGQQLGVSVTYLSEVPLPASGLLLFSSIFAFSVIRRRLSY
jgi:hypothetical protein